MSNATDKSKLLNYLLGDGVFNTFTVAQASARYKIANVSARINELRKEGHSIYTNSKTLEDGRKIKFYRYGKPSKRFIRLMKLGKVNAAVRSLYSQAA